MTYNLSVADKGRNLPEWLDKLGNAYAIHNVIGMRPELPFFIIILNTDNTLTWMELSDPHHRLKPYHFEIYFGKEANRDKHYFDSLKKASEKQEAVVTELFGFSDLFYPLPVQDDCRAFVHAGQFLVEQPSWDSLSKSWREMTGLEPASANPDFVHFVQMALGLPVLEPELISALIQFVKNYSLFLTGGHSQSVREKINDLNKEFFSRLWPITEWVDRVISSDKFLLPPWHYYGKLTDWIKEGMGISQLPTTAMALMPLDSRADTLDPVQTMVRNARIQRECIAYARHLPETSATRLQDYGVSIITLCKTGKSIARARLELREIAQKFRTFVGEKFHLRSVVGIGRTLSKGSPLYESHRDAVMSLHMCVQLGGEVLFYDEHGTENSCSFADLQKAADRLMEAIDKENNTELKLSADRYVQLVLRYSNERIEVSRSQFLATLFQLLKTVHRKNPIRKDARDSFADDLTKRLEEAHSLNGVIENFNEALQRLCFVSSKVWHGSNVMLLEATQQYLRENFFESLPLSEVARKAGFSVPAFTRVFKQATGTSFLAYLRSIRVEHAKKLLTTTPMTTEQIAQACGFHSQHHLIRSFKKVTGKTPGSYRKEKSHRTVEQ